MTRSRPTARTPSPPEHVPDDVALDESARNRLDHMRQAEPQRPIRELAADAAVTAAIGGVYEAG